MTTEHTPQQLAEYQRIHDFADPIGHLNAVEIAWLASDSRSRPTCPHCKLELRPLPMAGNGWGLEHIHEPGCPEGV